MMQRLFYGPEKIFMPRGCHAKVAINQYFGPVRQKGPDNGIAPDQPNFEPGDRCDQTEAIGCQKSPQQLGADGRPDHDRGRIGLFQEKPFAARYKQRQVAGDGHFQEYIGLDLGDG